MRRTNDMPIANPDVLYDDETARSALLHRGMIATQPGALAEATPVVQPNDLYGTHLRLIFYDEPIFGRYQKRFDKIFSEPRYTNLAANLSYFSAMYTSILTTRRAPETIERRTFYQVYYDTIARERQNMDVAMELVRP